MWLTALLFGTKHKLSVWWAQREVLLQQHNRAVAMLAHLHEWTTTMSLFLCELCRMVSWICPSGDCPRVVPLCEQSTELPAQRWGASLAWRTERVHFDSFRWKGSRLPTNFSMIRNFCRNHRLDSDFTWGFHKLIQTGSFLMRQRGLLAASIASVALAGQCHTCDLPHLGGLSLQGCSTSTWWDRIIPSTDFSALKAEVQGLAQWALRACQQT